MGTQRSEGEVFEIKQKKKTQFEIGGNPIKEM